MTVDRNPSLDLPALAADLRMVCVKLRRRMREQAGIGDLGWPHVAVLAQLVREGAATVTCLARAEGMRPQSMGAIVAALEQAGLVQGAPDPSDGRQKLWSATEPGREWIAAYRAAGEDWFLDAIQTRLQPDEQRALGEAIPLLKRLVEH